MADGIRKRHSKDCASRKGRRCNCNAGWEASIYLAREGKRITKTFSQKDEAKSWRTDALRATKAGPMRPTPADARTLAEAVAAYVAGMKDGSVRPRRRERYKPNTTRSYERSLRKHIAPSPVAGLRVGEIRRRDLQAFADDLLATGLSPATVSNAMNPIQAFYRRAIHRDELAYNPSALIDLPEGSSKRPKRIASAAEAAELLAVLPVEDRPVWATAFYAGLRRGELQALRVSDIDFAKNLVSVERGWDQVEGVIEPKSRAGRRTVPLLAVLRSYLWDFLPRTGRSEEDLLFGRTEDDAFFASTVDGRAKRAWKGRNKRECELAQAEGREWVLLRPITLHECRHTFASLLIDSGANPEGDPAVHGPLQNSNDL